MEKLFYSHIHNKDNAKEQLSKTTLLSYADSIIFDLNKRTLWHQGKQFGNNYAGSSYGESFNDLINNVASGDFSHAEGKETMASGVASHAAGTGTKATGDSQTVVGTYNELKNNANFIIGIGTDDAHRKNAFEVNKDGATYVKEGPLYIKGEDVIEKIESSSTNFEQAIKDSYNKLHNTMLSYTAITYDRIVHRIDRTYDKIYNQMQSYVGQTYNSVNKLIETSYMKTYNNTLSYVAQTYNMLNSKFDNINQSFNNEFKSYVAETYNHIRKNMCSYVGDTYNKLYATIQSYGSATYNTTYSTIKTYGDSIVTYLNKKIEANGGQTSTEINKIKQSITNLDNRVTTTYNTLYDTIKSYGAATYNTTYSTIKTYGDAIVTYLENKITSSGGQTSTEINKIKQSITNLDNRVTTSYNTLYDTIKSYGAATYNTTYNTIKTYGDAIVTYLENKITSSGGQTSTEINKIKQSITNLDNRVTTSYNTLYDTIKSYGAATYNTTYNTIKTYGDAIITYLENKITNSGGQTSTEISNIKQSITNVDNRVTSTYNTLCTYIKNAYESLKTYSTNYTDMSYNKLYNPMKSNFTTIYSELEKLNNSIGGGSGSEGSIGDQLSKLKAYVESAYTYLRNYDNTSYKVINDTIVSSYNKCYDPIVKKISELEKSIGGGGSGGSGSITGSIENIKNDITNIKNDITKINGSVNNLNNAYTYLTKYNNDAYNAMKSYVATTYSTAYETLKTYVNQIYNELNDKINGTGGGGTGGDSSLNGRISKLENAYTYFTDYNKKYDTSIKEHIATTYNNLFNPVKTNITELRQFTGIDNTVYVSSLHDRVTYLENAYDGIKSYIATTYNTLINNAKKFASDAKDAAYAYAYNLFQQSGGSGPGTGGTVCDCERLLQEAKDYTDTKIAGIVHPKPDLSNYYTKSEIDTKITGIDTSIKNMTASITDHEQRITVLEQSGGGGSGPGSGTICDCDKLMQLSYNYTDNKIAGIVHPKPDLSNYYTIKQIDDKFATLITNNIETSYNKLFETVKTNISDLRQFTGIDKTAYVSSLHDRVAYLENSGGGSGPGTGGTVCDCEKLLQDANKYTDSKIDGINIGNYVTKQDHQRDIVSLSSQIVDHEQRITVLENSGGGGSGGGGTVCDCTTLLQSANKYTDDEIGKLHIGDINNKINDITKKFDTLDLNLKNNYYNKTEINNRIDNIIGSDIRVHPAGRDKRLYIWTGLASQLPAKRYRNVIYITTETDPSNEIWTDGMTV